MEEYREELYITQRVVVKLKKNVQRCLKEEERLDSLQLPSVCYPLMLRRKGVLTLCWY